jgi:phosphoribosylglycinamide formyltransferase-1
LNSGVKIGIVSSGKGENLRYILEAIRSGYLQAEVSIVLTDKKDAGAIRIAQEYGINYQFIDPSGLSHEEYDQKLMNKLDSFGISLVVLTGYMRILSSSFVQHYPGRILNIHPALLPSFRGLNAFQQALDYGVKWSGTTIHLVDEHIDHGPIICQIPVPVRENDTYDSLKARIQRAEHKAYPRAIKMFIEGNPRIEGRRLVFDSKKECRYG